MKGIKEYLRDNDWAPACAPAVFACWLAVNLPRSFWRDEGITSWIASGSWPELLERTGRFASWMFLHGAVSKLFHSLPGPAELVLRLPSLLAALVCFRLVFLLGRRAGGDAQAGWLAVLCLAAMRMFETHAAEARAYVLTLMFSLAATLSFMKLAGERRSGHALLWAAFSACAFYAHMMAGGLAAAAQALYGLWRWRRDRAALLRLGAGLGLFALLLTPLTDVILRFPARSVVFLSAPLPWEISRLLFPLELVLGLGLGLAAAMALKRWPAAPDLKARFSSGDAAILAATWLPPVLALFLISSFTDLRIFMSRYAVASVASGAALAAVAIRSIAPRGARLMVIAAITAVSCGRAVLGNLVHPPEDWRGAVAEANSVLRAGDAFILQSPLVESSDRTGLEDPEKKRYLCSILSPYPLRADHTALPVFLTAADSGYIGKTVAETAPGKGRLFFMTAEKEDQADLFTRAAAKAGLVRTGLSRHGAVMLLSFDAMGGRTP